MEACRNAAHDRHQTYRTNIAFVPGEQHNFTVHAGGFIYWDFAYSARACFRMGISGSASFQSAKKSS
jgi:hypothetical protein